MSVKIENKSAGKNLVATPIQSDNLTLITGVQYQNEFIKFARWCGTPRHLRTPKTQKEFAESIGVCVDTLTDWKKHPQFAFFVWGAIKEWMHDRMPDIVDGLSVKILSGKAGVKDVELWFRLAGMDISSDKKK